MQIGGVILNASIYPRPSPLFTLSAVFLWVNQSVLLSTSQKSKDATLHGDNIPMLLFF